MQSAYDITQTRKREKLIRVHRILVYDCGPSDDSIPGLIDRVRERRLRELMGD